MSSRNKFVRRRLNASKDVTEYRRINPTKTELLTDLQKHGIEFKEDSVILSKHPQKYVKKKLKKGEEEENSSKDDRKAAKDELEEKEKVLEEQAQFRRRQYSIFCFLFSVYICLCVVILYGVYICLSNMNSFSSAVIRFQKDWFS